MIVDSHLHLRDDRFAGPEGDPDELIALMDAAGIAKAVVFQAWHSARSSIAAAEAAVGRFPDRMIPYVYAVPHYERAVLKELEDALRHRGFRGIKMHRGDCRLADYLTDPVLELAERLDAPCLVDFKGDAEAALRMAEKFPRTKLIVAHLGQCQCADEAVLDKFIAIAETRPNVFLDVSAVVVPRKISDAVRRVGSSRVVWGSDGPGRAPGNLDAVKRDLAGMDALGLSAAEKEDVRGGTIARLLKID